MANQDQAEYWNADESQHWIDDRERYDGMLAGFGAHLLDAAAPGAAEAVVDLGCGTGATTRAAARRAARGSALGIDISRAMIERARAQADEEQVGNVRFEVGDAQVRSFQPFDAAMSRFGVMFFDDPVAAFANVRGAMRRGGRLAFVCWQPLLENEWMLVPGSAAASVVALPDLGDPHAPGPFAFGDAEYVRELLERAGLEAIAISGVREPLLLGGRGADLEVAVTFLRRTGMARALLADAGPEEVERVLDAVRGALAPYVTDRGVELGAAAWLVEATRA